jgi:hypothetical protein
MKAAQRVYLAERRERVWANLLDGHTVTQIASVEKTNPAQIYRDLAWMTKEHTERLVNDLHVHKMIQVAQLQRIQEEAMMAWEASKKPDKRVAKTIRNPEASGDTEGGSPCTTITTSVTEQDGDLRYLDMALRTMREIRVILGLDAPIKFAQTDPTGMKQADQPAGLARLTELMQLLAAKKPPNGHDKPAEEPQIGLGRLLSSLSHDA